MKCLKTQGVVESALATSSVTPAQLVQVKLVSRVVGLNRLTVEGRRTRQHSSRDERHYLQIGDEVGLQEAGVLRGKTMTAYDLRSVLLPSGHEEEHSPPSEGPRSYVIKALCKGL